MIKEAIHEVMTYCTQENIPVQITFDHKEREWYADFTYDLHAKVCHSELVAAGWSVNLGQAGSLRSVTRLS